ncbi:MAG TPA: hypothetical protein VFQ70_03245 [Candidatus Saccharimonadaceae bacterium]|nr:hypothetical protein [Candidatus Saccharimonadaceae bacterium]
MDKGPFRAQRSADRPVTVRPPEPVAPNAVPTSQTPEQPPAPRTHASTPKQPHRKKRWLWVIAGIIVIIIATAITYFVTSSQDAGVDTSKYQAVSTTDGQVYFGKLTVLGNGYVRLTGAYYLQTQAGSSTSSSASQTSSSDKNSVKLVKLSNKIYGPEDEIFIARDQILSYENLAPNGQVAKWLQQNN